MGLEVDKEYFLVVVVPPILGAEVYFMSKYKVLIQYGVIYKDIYPKTFKFFRFIYIGIAVLILMVYAFPYAYSWWSS